MWEAGAGAIAAENQTLEWLAGLARFPEGAGGCFVSGGSAANLSALVTARHQARLRRGGDPHGARWCFAATGETHASVHAAARVMDVDVLDVPPDGRGRMTGAGLRAAIADHGADGLFAVVGNFGTTNVGAVDELDAVADVCAELDLWLHIDAAYGGAALCAPSTEPLRPGFERADSFGIDPHKWLFAPYDCAALVYRDPALASDAHTQHGTYLDMVSRDEWNPSDFAFHLSRRARGLPLWFSLATYGTDAYAEAVETTLDVARRFAAEVESRDGFATAPRSAAVGRPVHRRRLGRGALHGVERVTGEGRRGPHRADAVARRRLLPGVHHQSADDAGDALVAPRRHGVVRSHARRSRPHPGAPGPRRRA